MNNSLAKWWKTMKNSAFCWLKRTRTQKSLLGVEEEEDPVGPIEGVQLGPTENLARCHILST